MKIDVTKQLRKRIGANFIVNISGTFVTFLINVILARISGVEYYGQYVYVLSWVSLLVLVSKFGLDTTSLRFIPKYVSEENYPSLRGYRKKSSHILMVVSISVAVVSSLAVFLISKNIDKSLRYTFYISFILLPLQSYLILRGSYLQAFHFSALNQFLQILFKPILIGMVGLLYWLVNTQDVLPYVAMLINVLATIISILFSVYFFKKYIPRYFFSGKEEYKTLTWIKNAAPLLLVTSFTMIINQTDIIMLGMIEGTKEAGIYAVTTRICGFITFAMIITNAVAAPMISQLHTQDKFSELQKIISISAWGSGVFGLGVTLFLMFFGVYVLGIFGEEYKSASNLLILIAVGKMVLAISGTSGYLMSMSGHSKQAAKVMGFSTIINIVLNYIFINTYGIEGAAIATLITTFIWCGVMVILVRKYLNINSTIFVNILTLRGESI